MIIDTDFMARDKSYEHSIEIIALNRVKPV